MLASRRSDLRRMRVAQKPLGASSAPPAAAAAAATAAVEPLGTADALGGAGIEEEAGGVDCWLREEIEGDLRDLEEVIRQLVVRGEGLPAASTAAARSAATGGGGGGWGGGQAEGVAAAAAAGGVLGSARDGGSGGGGVVAAAAPGSGAAAGLSELPPFSFAHEASMGMAEASASVLLGKLAGSGGAAAHAGAVTTAVEVGPAAEAAGRKRDDGGNLEEAVKGDWAAATVSPGAAAICATKQRQRSGKLAADEEASGMQAARGSTISRTDGSTPRHAVHADADPASRSARKAAAASALLHATRGWRLGSGRWPGDVEVEEKEGEEVEGEEEKGQGSRRPGSGKGERRGSRDATPSRLRPGTSNAGWCGARNWPRLCCILKSVEAPGCAVHCHRV